MHTICSMIKNKYFTIIISMVLDFSCKIDAIEAFITNTIQSSIVCCRKICSIKTKK